MNTNSSQTSDSWLQAATSYLKAADISTARLDCMVLLQDALGADKASLLAHPELILHVPVLKLLSKQLARRARHEPLAYIRGKSEFYGREFIVTKDTLQPRPESETMLTLLKELIPNSQKSHLLQDSPVTDGENVIVDVGTGTGCLAISAKLEIPGTIVYGTDIDAKCLQVARQNASKLHATIDFFQGNLLEPIPDSVTVHIILANLPYVPEDHNINMAATYEPKHAIFGGQDGLAYYRGLFQQIVHARQRPAYVITESLPFQHAGLVSLAESAHYARQTISGLIQVFTAV